MRNAQQQAAPCMATEHVRTVGALTCMQQHAPVHARLLATASPHLHLAPPWFGSNVFAPKAGCPCEAPKRELRTQAALPVVPLMVLLGGPAGPTQARPRITD